MMEKMFLQVLNMSFTASLVIVFVLAARLFLKKVPRAFTCALWSVYNVHIELDTNSEK